MRGPQIAFVAACMKKFVMKEREAEGGNWETCIGTVNGILFSKASAPSLALSLFGLSRFICAVAVGSHGIGEKGEGGRGRGKLRLKKKWVSVHRVD